ncbi:MAG: hypothetical protein AAB074_03210 [Planctomycetota bacterium]
MSHPSAIRLGAPPRGAILLNGDQLDLGSSRPSASSAARRQAADRV